MTNNPARLATHVAGIPACKAGQTCIYWFFNPFSGVVHLGVASRDRALADIAAALCSLFLAAVTNTPAGSAAAGAADRRSHFEPARGEAEHPSPLLSGGAGHCRLHDRRAINPSVFGVLFNNWALVLAILLTTLAISGLTGWLLVRYSALPGATGAWGSSPGGASAMVVMAQEYGADVRLVALMQYLRVLFVVGAAALVVRYALGNEAQEMTQDIVWFPSLTLNFPFTLLLTAVACWLGMRLRIPSGAMLLPMLLGALAQGGGWLMLELPEWLLAMAYAVLGWTVGLQFNKAIFLLALKTLPQIIASIIGLILMCALMALALTHILQMDFMTAYLATSPGGLDTVAIIAAGTRADMSFIMALQTLRLFTILLTGPAMARAISRYAPRQ